jgi:adenosine deaminase
MATLTTNKNFLSPTGFQFKINSTQYANLEYFAVGATLPGVSMSASEQAYRGVNLAFTGDRLTFEDLTLRINVTENLENYIETFDWMHNLAQTSTAEDFKVDATLLILTSHNNVVKEIQFKGVFPTSMSAVEFDTQTESIEYVQMDITFNYTNFEFV